MNFILKITDFLFFFWKFEILFIILSKFLVMFWQAFLITMFGLIFCGLHGQTVHQVEDQVILVQLELNDKLLQSNLWNDYVLENKRIVLHLDVDQKLADIENIEEEDKKLTSYSCFIPTLKLIYKDYTYFISTLCNRVKKFKNIKPFITGTDELPTNAICTQELLQEITKYQAIFFGPTYSNEYKVFAQKNASAIQKNSNSSPTSNTVLKDDMEDEIEDEDEDDEDSNIASPQSSGQNLKEEESDEDEDVVDTEDKMEMEVDNEPEVEEEEEEEEEDIEDDLD